jgi:hypothetical protein
LFVPCRIVSFAFYYYYETVVMGAAATSSSPALTATANPGANPRVIKNKHPL